jgi:hypothetical protein
MIMIVRILPLLIVLGCGKASAEIEPVLHLFNFHNETYVVPSNKVLVLENLIWGRNRTGQPALSIVNASDQIVCELLMFGSTSISDFRYHPLNRPIKVPGGFKLVFYLPEGNASFSITGLLVDPADLYASIESDVESMKLAGNQVQMNVGLESKAPVRLKVEESTDLKSWVSSSSLTSRTETGVSTTVPHNGESKKFIRVVAQKRSE